ncbi:MAG: 2-oxoacid:acceptor oxidoreductase subunit alpha [Alphaproteobacteria bacterium]|nr:2-oxoacid:acceptor oxidoreductase subunit alpha [Alphaproteobacteria bacterium]
MTLQTVCVALVGSGGAGVMTAGQMLLEAASKAGYYGLMTRSSGPQIRGGEAAAYVRIGSVPVTGPADSFDVLVALDWQNVNRFTAELPLSKNSVILTDPEQGDMPEALAKSGAAIVDLPMKKMAEAIKGGRANMVALGVVGQLFNLPLEAIEAVVGNALKHKGAEAMQSSSDCIRSGAAVAGPMTFRYPLAPAKPGFAQRWNISGNEAAGYGVVQGGAKFCAAYPITPGTEILEWLAPNLTKIGGTLVQAEDELASVNMIIGASFGGVPSVTATSGPGLALMTESIGLAVASETPIVIIDVQRGGPSTGIPTKSEQSDLNIACYGLHGDAPHIVTAANAIDDCLLTGQWSMHLAETLQAPVIMLSDQALGQSRAVVDAPKPRDFKTKRLTPTPEALAQGGYKRYADTSSGISPMSYPGMPGGEYTADGLEHAESGTPSSADTDHAKQLNKRSRKLVDHDFGSLWADIEGEGEIAVITWGSATGPVREAVERMNAKGRKAKLVSLRLLLPAQPAKLAEALKGVKKILVVEQSHEAQFLKFMRAHYDLPGTVKSFHRPGPLPVRPHEIERHLDQL